VQLLDGRGGVFPSVRDCARSFSDPPCDV
jgi:hypothetical protein